MVYFPDFQLELEILKITKLIINIFYSATGSFVDYSVRMNQMNHLKIIQIFKTRFYNVQFE